ncbi:structural toxin protein RtxA [Legionella quinlivanii]|uniref:Structural toxin protein RtxA n=1 Tax=Legionella quinlivanii TaxID=45073 RepID=A0A0W0XKV1_9GAMM|nr:DUF5801 repeats-in-toxin domain-containing protein [Legionella quinlivanii]KTD45277.1 structural toxin protein RtxA [Legionella quinlivanii]SEG03092.1 T1SS-143 domain-containing protein [Legionella quinlivanii DSM 21216]STY11423.1 structural toxin protein RtxA [Legionella quinlivanii]
MASQAISGEVQALQGLLVRTNENGQCKILKQGSLIHAGDTLVLLGGGDSLIKLLFQPAISLLPDQAYSFQLKGISPLINKIPETPLDQLLNQTQLKNADIIKLIEQLEEPAAGDSPLQSGGASFYIDKPLFSLGHVGAGYDTRFAENSSLFDIEQNNVLWLKDPKPEAVLRLNDSELTLDESITVKNGDNNVGQSDLVDPFGFGKPISIAEGNILSSSSSQFNQNASAITTSYALELGDSPSDLKASDGSSIKLVLENNLVLGKSGNTVVFAIGIDEGSGKITVVQYHGLYHNDPNSPDESLSLANLVKASLTLTDTSGDVSKATVEIGSKIHFEDDAPIIQNVQQASLVDTTIEHQIINGTVQVDFGSDLAKDLTFSSDALRILQSSQLTSNGEALVYTLSRDGHSITATVQGTDITVFKLSLSAVIPNAEQIRMPSYQFQLFQALDQPPNKITLGIPIKAIDADNDVSQGQIRITITDGADAAGGSSSLLSSTEGDLDANAGAYPVSTNHTFTIEAGVDRLLPQSLNFANGFLDALLQEFNQEVTAGGLPLHISSTVVNGVITLTALDSANEVVFQLKLTPVNVGQNIQVTAELIQYKPLDHQVNGDTNGIIRQNGSSIDFDIKLQAKDSDGDSLQNPVNLHVQINDANPPVLGQDQMAFTESTVQQVLIGQVPLDLGSDTIATMVFEDSALMQGSLTSLTSGGFQTSYQINGNELSIRINDPQSASNGQELLKVILNTDGSYTATLKGPFDQVNDISELILTVRATDKDGDPSNLGAIHLTIQDAPSQNFPTQASTSLIEGDLAPGTYPVTSPVAEFTLQSSGDRLLPETIRFDPATINDLLSELSQEIKVDGQPLDFIVQNNQIIGSLNGSAIVVIALSADQSGNHYNVDGHLTITLNGPIDHNQTNNTRLVHLAGDQISIQIGVQITDADGDSLANPAQITASIADGAPPQLIHVEDITLAEPVSTDATSSSAHILIDIGSDAIKSLTFNYTNGENSGLLSGTHPVLLEINNGVLHGYYIENGIEVSVFNATLTNQGNQAVVDFELYKPIDHTQPGQDSVTLPIKIIAVDTDGDSATVSVPVHISDSVAHPEAVTATVIEGDTVLGNLSSSYQLNVEGGRLYSFTVNGTAYTFDAAHSSFSVTTDKGLLTVNSDGSWNLQSLDGLDHDFVQQLPVSYTVIDGDGDFASSSLLITITDGSPSSGGQTLGNALVEGDLAPMTYPVTAISPTLTVVNNGSDPFDLSTFAIQNPAALAAELQADLQFFNSVTGQTESLIATVGNDSIVLRSSSGELVLEVKLIAIVQANQDLSLTQTITLYQPLSHLLSNNSGVVTLGNDQIQINYQVQVADIDGDLLVNPLNLSATISDGANPVIDDAATIVQDGSSVSSGTLDVNIGSDPIASIRFDASQPALANLTSNGYSTTTTVSDHSIKIFDHNQQLLAEITLNNNGSYSVQLNGPLDQGINNVLGIPLNVTATDKDGDSDSAILQVSIQDGANPQGGQVINLAVTEGDLSAANGYPVSDMKSFTVTAGSDRLLPQSIEIDSSIINTIINELNSELKSGGQPINFTYDANTHTITGSIGSLTILSLSIDASQSSNGYDVDVTTRFIQYQPLDHSTTGNNTGYAQVNGNSLSINTPIQLTDSDGDKLAAPINLTTTVGDGVLPVLSYTGDIVLTEPVSSTVTTGTTTLLVDIGSDSIKTLTFNYTNGENSGLLSGGHPVLLEVNNGVLQGYYLENNVKVAVFNATLGNQGEVNFQMLKPIDHSQAGQDSITLPVRIIAVDSDGDSATLSIPVRITDTVAHPQAVTATVIEGDTVMGNLSSSYQLNAEGGRLYSFTVNGTQYTFDATHTSYSVSTAKGLLTVNSDGSWSLQSVDGLDHDFVQQLPINYTVIDGDGDFASSTMVITITDGSPSSGGQTLATAVAEGDLSPLTYPVSVISPTLTVINNGSDPFDLSTFTIQNPAALAAELQAEIQYFNPLTGQTEAVVATVSNNSIVLRSTSGELVLEVKLTPTILANQDLSISQMITLYQPLSHITVNATGAVANNLDQIRINYQVQIADIDGDLLVNPVNVSATVSDGANPIINDANTVVVDGSSVSSGVMDFNIGSDPISSIRFATNQPALANLTSNGLSTTTNVSTNSIKIMDSNQNIIAEIILNNNGSYSVTLSGPFDQAVNNVLNIPLNVIAQDKDGDQDTAILRVSINDGANPQGGNVVNLAVVEGSLSVANGYPVSDVKSFVITAGSDRLLPQSIQIDSTVINTILSELGSELKSNGQTITFTYDSNTHAITGKIGSDVVLTLTVNATQSGNGKDVNVTTTFVQYQPLDHLQTGNATGYVSINGTTISINTPVQISDSDGDKLVAPVNLTTTVTDGLLPVINPIAAITVKESDINASTGNHAGSTAASTGEAATGSISVQTGSDKVVSYSIDVQAFNSGVDGQWKSGGVPIILSYDAVNDIYRGTANGVSKFTLKMNASGTYTFTLTGSIDHPVEAGKNNLDVIFSVVAKDADGDISAVAKLPVTVQDDIPDAVNTSFSAITEGATTTTVDLLPTAREGADTGKIVSVWDGNTQYNITGTGDNQITLHNDANGQVIGVLHVFADGRVFFVSSASIDHDGLNLVKNVRFDVRDFDGDIDNANITLTINDKAASIVISAASGVEDVGRDSNEVLVNPQGGIPINMTINIGDFDNSESIGKVLIQAPATSYGDFYYNGILLSTVVEGGITYFVIPPQAFSSADQITYTLNGLTFVPRADFSSYTANLSFTVRATVDYQVNGNTLSKAAVTGTLNIDVKGIADVPVWDLAQTTQHSIGTEDAANIPLQIKAALQDTDGSETIDYYLVKITSGNASLIGNGLTPDANGYYKVSPANLSSLQIDPATDYSGMVKVSAIAVSKESGNFLSGFQYAQSQPIELTIDVKPVADNIQLNINKPYLVSNEDAPINLGSFINVSKAADNSDLSENSFIRISNLPDGAYFSINGTTLNVAGLGAGLHNLSLTYTDSQGQSHTIQYQYYKDAVDSSKNYYQFNNTDFSDVRLHPVPESNVDFAIKVQAVVIDQATLSTGVETDTQITSEQVILINLKGISDAPVFDVSNTSWSAISNGVETTIPEDGQARLDFKLLSGEKALAPTDTSETITMVISNLPAGAQLLDSNGNTVTLTYVGLDANGQPKYEINLTTLSDLVVIPPPNSTADMSLNAHIVVTENDGNYLVVDKQIVIHVTPVIDAGDYARGSAGLEDGLTTVNWRPPTFSDSQEFISGLRIENIPQGTQLFINGVAITTLGDSSVTLTTAQLNNLLQGQSLQIRAAEDSDMDINLKAITSVSQQDVNGSPTVTKDIVGDLHIDLQAVVEPDATLNVLTNNNVPVNNITALNGTTVNLSTNASSQGHLTFQDLDPSSAEVIQTVVITGLGNQFVVTGGIYDGVGNWIVPASALDNLQITSKFGYNGSINVTFHAQVRDLGDNNEQDISNPAFRSTTVTMNFTGGGGGPGDPPVEAGTITITPATIHTQEDIPQSISSQLSSMLSLSNGTSDDVYALLIQGPLPQGFVLSGSGVIYDFVNDRYVIQVNADALGNLSVGEVILQTPVDYSGSLPFALNWAAANMVSGDSNTGSSNVSAPLDVAPVVDVPANPAVTDPNHTPAVSLQVVQTEGLNTDKQPVTDGSDVTIPNAAFEDGLVILRLNVASADIDSSEQINSVQLKVDPAKGYFVDSNGLALPVDSNGFVTVSVSDLNHLQFKPVNDFSGQVSVTAVINLVDQALNSQGQTVTDSASYTKVMNFDVLPVNDPVHFGGQFNFSGNEDVAGGVPLSGMTVNTTDTDGSEKIVSLVIRGVPDDFLISSAQNMGNGDWKITVNAASFDLSSIKVIAPENFSGSLDLEVVAFTKEALAALPGSGGSHSIHLDINPVSDPVDIIGAGAASTASGIENGQISINLNFQARDNVDSYNGSATNVQENGPESLLITVKGVPTGSEIQLPAGVNGTLESKVYDNASGEWIWTFKINASNLGSIIFLPGDFNGNAELTIQAQSVDNQAAPGAVREVNVAVDITAVNDAPVNIHPASFDAQEDQSVLLNNIQISDVDAREANGNMTITLSVEHGVLTLTGPLSGIMLSGNGSNTVTLVGQLDAVNQALNGNLHYQSNLNYNGSDSLVINTNDNGNSGGPALSAVSTVPINITAVNDAPVNITPSIPLEAAEDQVLTINTLRVSDVDAGAGAITITLGVEHGLLSLAGSAGAVTVSGEFTNHLVLTGTVNDLNNLLTTGIQYQGLANYFGPDALTMTSNDLGNTGGPALSDSDIVDIVVAARSDNPEMTILYHSVVAALAVLIPLNIQAEVANPAANELRVRLDGLGDAIPVDENGNPLGQMLAQGSWEISAGHLQQLHLQNVSEGEHTITVTAISDVGDNNPQESASQTIDLNVVNSSLNDLQNTQDDHSNTHLVGSELEDVLRGVFGDDMLDGKGGNDLLIGGDGNDILIGGKGNDTLTGGAGHDIFLWQANDHGVEGSPERDVITDFNPQEDKLDLSQLLSGENESNLAHYLHFAYDADSDTTTLSISSQGHFDGTEVTPLDVTAKTDQEIVINGDLVGPATTQAEIINTLFAAQQIVVDV